MLPRKSKLLWRNLWWLRSQYLGEWFGHSLSKLCSSNDETRQSHARFDSLLWCRLQAVSKWSLWREPHPRSPSMHCECTVAHRRCRNLPGNDIRKPRDFFSSEVSSLSKGALNGMVGRRAVEWEPTTSWVEAKLYIYIWIHSNQEEDKLHWKPTFKEIIQERIEYQVSIEYPRRQAAVYCVADWKYPLYNWCYIVFQQRAKYHQGVKNDGHTEHG